MRQGNWRNVLKFRTIVQIIASIVSEIAAIHSLLKKQRAFKGVSLAGDAPLFVSIMARAIAKVNPRVIPLI